MTSVKLQGRRPIKREEDPWKYPRVYAITRGKMLTKVPMKCCNSLPYPLQTSIISRSSANNYRLLSDNFL